MKNIFIGLIIGVVLCGLAGFLALPGIKKTAYDSGVEEGTKKGIAQGTTAGIAQGIAQLKAEQMQKHEQDSLAAVKRYKEARRKAAAMRKPVEKPKPVQNWHVINGKIDDPIINESK